MILTVTPNPALDLTWLVPSLHPGESHRVASGVGRAGGKGLNVSRVLHQMDHPTHAVTSVGGSTGVEFRAELEASGVPHTLIETTSATRRSLALVDEEASEATVLNEYGSPLDRPESDRFWAQVDRLARDARVVVLSGSLPRDTDPVVISSAVGRLRATGRPVLVDTSGPAMLAAVAAGASVVKPNADELREATGFADLDQGITDLFERGATCVVASLGADGLIVAHRDGRRVRARMAQSVRGNATGAGDAVTAAIAVSLADDPDLSARGALEVLARRAVAWGAAAVAMPQAGSLEPTLAGRTADVDITETENDR